MWVCFCLLFYVCANKQEKNVTLAIKQPIKGLSKQTDTGTPQNKLSERLSNHSVGDRQSEWIKNGENRKINFAYITFFVVNATFVLQFCSFMVLFPNQTSEIDLPRISLVFFVFLFVSVILFILICLHSSYNIYKTSQKYKRICWENYTIIASSRSNSDSSNSCFAAQ